MDNPNALDLDDPQTLIDPLKEPFKGTPNFRKLPHGAKPYMPKYREVRE